MPETVTTKFLKLLLSFLGLISGWFWANLTSEVLLLSVSLLQKLIYLFTLFTIPLSLSTLLLLKNKEEIQSLIAFLNTTILDLMFVFVVLLITEGLTSQLFVLKFAGALLSLIFWQVFLGLYVRSSDSMRWKTPEVLVVVANQHSAGEKLLFSHGLVDFNLRNFI